MAKTDSIIQFRGTLGKTTFVDSKAYGPYARAARGSIKPATLNAACLESSNRLLAANAVAKMVFGPVNSLRGEFKGGDFWQRLLRIFRKQMKSGATCTFKDLHELEIRLDRRLALLLDVSIKDTPEGVLLNPDFKSFKRGSANGFCLTLMRIVCAADLSARESVHQQDYFVRFDDPNPERLFHFEAPVYADAQIVYCLKAESALDGKPLNYITGTGMCLLRVSD